MSAVVATLSQLADSAPFKAVVDGQAVLVVRIGQDVHAVDDTCTHAEVSLSEGEVVDCTIECWLHGSAFSLVTGAPTGPPASSPLAVHTVTLGDQADPEVTVTLGRS